MAFSFHGSVAMLLSIVALSASPLHSQAGIQPAVTEAKPIADASITIAVTDTKRQPVTDLKAADFSITHGGKPLMITSAQLVDTPACIGLTLDRSGSMRSKIPTATSSVLDFVKASNPADKFFVVNFNDNPYLDQDYTSDAGKIQKAIELHESRGGTAIYDAVIASSDHLMENKDCKRRILIVLTDGGDNTSHKPVRIAMDYLEKMKGLSMRLVMITDAEPNVHASHRALEELVSPVEGKALFITLNKLENTFQQMALELRNQYVITYKPESPSSGDLSDITVSARAEGHKDLRVQVEATETSGETASAK